MSKLCRHWIANRLHRCERTRPETSTFSGESGAAHMWLHSRPHIAVSWDRKRSLSKANTSTHWQPDTHRTFSWRATSFLLAMQSIFTINNQETMKSMGKWHADRLYQNQCLSSGKADVHIQQSPAPYTGTRAAWWIVSVKATQECNTFILNLYHWLVVVSMKQLLSEAQWYLRKKKKIKQESCSAKRKLSLKLTLTEETKLI